MPPFSYHDNYDGYPPLYVKLKPGFKIGSTPENHVKTTYDL